MSAKCKVRIISCREQNHGTEGKEYTERRNRIHSGARCQRVGVFFNRTRSRRRRSRSLDSNLECVPICGVSRQVENDDEDEYDWQGTYIALSTYVQPGRDGTITGNTGDKSPVSLLSCPPGFRASDLGVFLMSNNLPNCEHVFLPKLREVQRQ